MRAVRTGVRAARTAGLVGGLVMVGWGLRPAPDAPLPPATFDLRTEAPAAARRRPPARPAPVTSEQPSAVAVVAPTRVLIPTLGVDAPVRPQRVAQDGSLVIPGDPHQVGVWHADPRRRTGVTVLAGHVDRDGDLGALHPLSRVTAGDEIVLADAQGGRESWRVEALEVRSKDDLPPLPATGPRRLAVVTCGGPVVETATGRTYRDNVLVWAVPVA